MSYQAMGAVQLHSRYREDVPDNFAPYKIMLALAWYADANGRIGQPGDFRKCPGQRAIADRAGVSKTTVNKWLALIIAAGELSIVESGGGGRGSWTVYQIELEMDQSAGTFSETTYQATSESATDDTGTLIERTYQLMERTYQLMYQQTQRTYQQNVPNVPSPLEVGEPDPYDPFDPNDPGRKYIYAHDLPDEIQEMMSAIAGVVKTPLGPGINEDEFEKAAYTLAGWEVDPVDVFGFLEWWDLYGYYQGKPALKSFLSEYQNYKAGIRPEVKAAANGRSASRAEQVAAEYALAKQEFFSDE